MKYIFFILGSLMLLLGLLGVALPVLPTTPFVMLSLFCYGKSSNRFYQYLIQSSFYDKYAKEFIEQRCMTRKRKITLVSFASLMLLFPLLRLFYPLKIIIIGTYIYLYYYFIVKIKTISKN